MLFSLFQYKTLKTWSSYVQYNLIEYVVLITMATSRERQKVNLARIKEILQEIENTTNDSELIVELHRLLRRQYPLSLKWHTIVFRSEVENCLWHLEGIRKEECEIAKRRRKPRKDPEEGLKQAYYDYSEIPSAFKPDFYMVYDSKSNRYKWIRYNASRNLRANVFAIPKSMIGDGKLHWSEEVKRKWGEDNIGQQELLEKSILN